MTQNQLMTYGSIAFAGFAAWFALKKTGVLPTTGEQQRMEGTADWLNQNAAQTTAVQQAVSQQWRSLNQVFNAQPDFYV